jgi:hypothetical protein
VDRDGGERGTCVTSLCSDDSSFWCTICQKMFGCKSAHALVHSRCVLSRSLRLDRSPCRLLGRSTWIERCRTCVHLAAAFGVARHGHRTAR